MTNLIVAGSALIGAGIGVFGTLLATNRQLAADRRKANYEIKKEDFETRLRDHAELSMASNTSGWDAFDSKSKDGLAFDEVVLEVRKRFGMMSDCIRRTPWAFSTDIRASHETLNGVMNDLEMMRARFLRGHPCDDVANFGCPSMMKMLDELPHFKYLIDQSLKQLIQEYEAFKNKGI